MPIRSLGGWLGKIDRQTDRHLLLLPVYIHCGRMSGKDHGFIIWLLPKQKCALQIFNCIQELVGHQTLDKH